MFVSGPDAQVPPTNLQIGEGRYSWTTFPNETYNLLKCSVPNCASRAAWQPVVSNILPSQVPVTVTYGAVKEEYSVEACISGGQCVWRSWDRFVHDPALVPPPPLPPPGPVRLAQPWVGLDGGFTAGRPLAFPLPNTAGCTSFVAVRVGHPTVGATVTDIQANVYALAREQVQSTDGHRAVLFYGKNLKAGPNAVMVRLTASTTLRYAIGEYCGLDLVSPFADAISGQGRSALPNSGTLTNAAATLALGFGTAALQPVWTPEVGFTLRIATANKLAIEDRFGPPPGAISAGFALGVVDNWAVILATFK